MALKWTVVVIDRSSGSPVEQDVTPIQNYDQSQYQFPSQQTKGGTLDLSFLYTASWNIQEGSEWQAGWRDTVTHEWSNTDPDGLTEPVRGGYLLTQQGGADGPIHTIVDGLTSYDYDLGTTDIVVWPDLATYPTPYPDGYSATDWLVGTVAGGKPYDGLIPARLGAAGGYLLDGVDSALDSFIFGAGTGVKPGVPLRDAALNGGLWGFVDLQSAIDDIMTAVRFMDGSTDFRYWVDAAIDPGDATQIRPRFRVVDWADTTGTVAATFATDPGVGEWQIYQPFSHTRDIHEARQRIIVWGEGTANGQLNGPPLYAVGYQASRPVQPTVYQTDPGRSGKPFFNSNIKSLLQAQGLADQLEAYAWGPAGTIRFRTRRPTLPGEIVAVRILPEGQTGTRYRVADVTTVPGVERFYDVTIGQPLPDLAGLLQRTAARQNALQELAALGLPLPFGQSGQPGQPRRYPVVAAPGHDQDNIVQAANPDTPGLTIRQPYQQPGAPPVTPTVPALRAQTYNSTTNAWETKTWVSADDGRPHPAEFHLGAYTADGNYSVTVAVRTVTITALDLAGTGSATLLRNGTAVSSAISGDGHHVLGTPVTFSPSTGAGVAGDKIGLTISGSSSSDPLHCVAWES